MKKSALSTIALLLLLSFAFTAAALKTGLPDRYKKWLEEEVIYIITPVEKDVFLKLQTDRERDMFMEAFWKQRDPTPNSAENEFKTEHYRRIQYADRFLGRETPKPGWKTERGSIYIILGEPNDIQRIQSESNVYNCEIWFYQGKTDLGLPSGFYVLFFQEKGHGEYKIYSPTNDGPMALLANYTGAPDNYMAAYRALREVDLNLANVSLSLIPGDESTSLGRPSLASDILVRRIENAPQRMIKEKYARKFLQYKDIVDVEYTANYLESEGLIKVFRDPSGISFIHFALEPKRLSVNAYENKYYTTLKLNGTLTAPGGKLVYQFERTISLDIPQNQMQALSHQPFEIHDVFPVIPGEYNLSLLVKNEISKEFMSWEQPVRIVDVTGRILLSEPLLGYKITRLDPPQNKLKPFCLGSLQISCQPNRIFIPKETLAVAVQVFGLTDEVKAKAEIRFSFLRDGQVFRHKTRKLTEIGDLPNVVEEFPLGEFPPAHYNVRITLMNEGTEIATTAEEFDVTFAPAVARPWVHARILPESGDAFYFHILGVQLFNMGRLAEARTFLERACAKRPDAIESALVLAQVLSALGQRARIIPLLQPFIADEQKLNYEALFLMGQAYQATGEFEKAISLFDRAGQHFGINAGLLNAIGECYAELGRIQEALAVWEESLEMNSDQPEIRKKVEELHKKK